MNIHKLCKIVFYAIDEYMKKKTIKKEIMDFNAVFLEEKDGGYSVSVPSLPGCFSQGDDFENAVQNIREAIELYLEKDEIIIEKRDTRKEFMVPVTVYW